MEYSDRYAEMQRWFLSRQQWRSLMEGISSLLPAVLASFLWYRDRHEGVGDNTTSQNTGHGFLIHIITLLGDELNDEYTVEAVQSLTRRSGSARTAPSFPPKPGESRLPEEYTHMLRTAMINQSVLTGVCYVNI